MFDRFQQDVDFHCEEGGEEGEEDEEGEHHTAAADVADTYPCGHHVLDGPWLAPEFGDKPTRLTAYISQGQKSYCRHVEKAQFGACHVLAPRDECHHGEEQEEECAETHHHAEGIEAQRDVGHEVGLVLDISISEVGHVVLYVLEQLCLALRGNILLAIFLECRDGDASAANLLVAVLEQVVDTGNEAVDVAGGEEGEGVGNLDFESRILARGIVGLLEGIDERDGCKSLTLTAVIECLHSSEFHRLHLCHHVCRVVAGVKGEQ